ncbi:MAG: hypothetical protein AAGA57_10090 [Planctomycetota bacterium]
MPSRLEFACGWCRGGVWFAFALMAGLAALGGCASDTHNALGRVIVGVGPRAEVVSDDDPRLRSAPPAAGVRVQSKLDPRSIDSKPLPTVRADGDGWFVIPIDAFGAGILIYELELEVEGGGLLPLRGAIVAAPTSRERVLVTLPPSDRRADHQPDLLRDTLELGRPYMRGER